MNDSKFEKTFVQEITEDGTGKSGSFKSVDMISQEEFEKLRVEAQAREEAAPTVPPPPPKPIMMESHLNPDAKPFTIPSTREAEKDSTCQDEHAQQMRFLWN